MITNNFFVMSLLDALKMDGMQESTLEEFILKLEHFLYFKDAVLPPKYQKIVSFLINLHRIDEIRFSGLSLEAKTILVDLFFFFSLSDSSAQKYVDP